MSKSFTILQLVHIDETGDSCYRMRWPAEALLQFAPEWRVINAQAEIAMREEWALEADLLVLYQCLDRDLLPIIEKRRAKGLKTLVEYNDNFYAPQPWSPVAGAWQKPEVRAAYEAFMHSADGVLVTGEGLFKLFSNITQKPIYILENQLPVAPPSLQSLEQKKTLYPSFGWAGSLGHIADLLAMVPVIHEILETVPGSKFHVMGNSAIPEIIHVPADRLVYVPWGTMDDYYAFWEQVQVGFAPLLPSAYNDCRSDIKALEMISRGVAPVLSNATPYKKLASSLNMPLYKTTREIGQAAIKLLKESAHRISWVQPLYNAVSTSRIASARHERFDLYKAALPEKPSNYNWKSNPGYHEIKEPIQVFSKYQLHIEKIKPLLAKSDRAESLKLSIAHLNENTTDPERLLLSMRLAASQDRSLWEELCIHARKTHPDDLRFLLLIVTQLRDAIKVRECWSEILTFLEKMGPYHCILHFPELTAAMMGCLDRDQTLVTVAEQLLISMPFQANLRIKVALLLELQGKYQAALNHFTLLLESLKAFKQGGETIKELDQGYLEAWVDSLTARVDEGYGVT